MSENNSILTPCVQLCEIEPESGLCVGCLRTRAEIGGWRGMSDLARAQIMSALEARRPLLKRKSFSS